MTATVPSPAVPEFLKIAGLHRVLETLPPVECPVQHRFTPGMYAREIFMPAGALVISRVHRTRHPFVVLSGRVLVYSPASGVVELAAGHVRITEPGTQRVLLIVEDCRWITFHPTVETDLEKLQEELTTTPDLAGVAASDEARAWLEQLRAVARPSPKERLNA